MPFSIAQTPMCPGCWLQVASTSNYALIRVLRFWVRATKWIFVLVEEKSSWYLCSLITIAMDGQISETGRKENGHVQYLGPERSVVHSRQKDLSSWSFSVFAVFGHAKWSARNVKANKHIYRRLRCFCKSFSQNILWKMNCWPRTDNAFRCNHWTAMKPWRTGWHIRWINTKRVIL